jgi:hypothetical protein
VARKVGFRNGVATIVAWPADDASSAAWCSTPSLQCLHPLARKGDGVAPQLSQRELRRRLPATTLSAAPLADAAILLLLVLVHHDLGRKGPVNPYRTALDSCRDTDCAPPPIPTRKSPWPLVFIAAALWQHTSGP